MDRPSVKIEQIDVSKIDFAVGFMRGVLSRPDFKVHDTQQAEELIKHLRGAARVIERLQKQGPARAKSRSSRGRPVSSGARRNPARCRP